MSNSAEARSILDLSSSGEARQQIAQAVESALSERIARDLSAFVEQLVAIVRAEADGRAAEFEIEAVRLRARLDERARSAEDLARSLAEAHTELEDARREAHEHAERAAALQLEQETLIRARKLAEEAWEQVEADAHRLRVSLERRIRDLEAELAAQRAVTTSAPSSAPTAAAVSIVPPAPRETAAATPRALTLVEPAKREQAAVIPIHSAASQLESYAAELVDQLKTAYAIDLAAGLAPTAIVDRLMTNVRGANDAFARESASVGGDPRVLDRRLTELIDAEAATSFGRHLAVALYVVGPDHGPGTAAS
jgi:hypothetical protein